MYSYITSELPKTVFDNFKQVDPERVSIFGHSMGGHGALTLVGTPSLPLPFLLRTNDRPLHCIVSHRSPPVRTCTKFLKNPGKYKSVSAFAPIANPSKCPWGQKAFGGYFGEEDKAKWAEHDATELVKKWSGEPLDVLIDVVCWVLFFFLLFSLLFPQGKQASTTQRSFPDYVSIYPSIYHNLFQLLKFLKKKQGTNDNFYHQGQLLPENFIAAAKDKGNVKVRWQDGYDHSYFTMATFADDHVAHAARYLLA